MIEQLDKAGASIARAALPISRIKYGPWQGSVESMPSDSIPRDFVAGAGTQASSNFLYIPRYGTWKRRGGQTIKFDTLPSSSGVGLLPAKWGAKGRQMEEFLSSSVDDGIPTVMALATKETLADSDNLDDGRFSNVYIRDQSAGTHYTLGSEFSTSDTYPAIGTEQSFKWVPLWYDSASGGGMTRGISEFSRRFLVSGSRRMLRVGNWWYFPSVYGTPARWRSDFTTGSSEGGAEIDVMRPDSDTSANLGWGTSDGGTPLADYIDDESDSDFVRFTTGPGLGGNYDGVFDSGMTDPTGASVIRVTVRARTTVADGTNAGVTLSLRQGSGTAQWGSNHEFGTTASGADTVLTSSFASYSYDLSAADIAIVNNNAQPLTFRWAYSGVTSSSGVIDIAWFKVEFTNESGTQKLRPNATTSAGSWRDQAAGATNLQNVINEGTANDADYIVNTLGTSTCTLQLSAGTAPAGAVPHIFRYRYKVTSGSCSLNLINRGGSTIKANAISTVDASFATVEVTLTAAEIALISDYALLDITLTQGATPSIQVSWVEFEIGSRTVRANRLIPSGPLPPTHAGSLAKGTATTQGVTSTLLPNADQTDGTWVKSSDGNNTDLYTMLDEAASSDADYVISGVASNSTGEVHLTSPSAAPAADAVVQLKFRVAREVTFIGGGVDVALQLIATSTIITTMDVSPSTSFAEYTITLTAAEIAATTAVTSNWSDVRARFTTFGAGATAQAKVSHIVCEITNAATSDAVWRGRDRFLYSVAYKFEDGSIWAPCTPRVPNATLTTGFNMFTVDSTAPDTVYDKVTWSNIPIGPFGCIGRILLRSPKINSTDSDGQELNPFDLRVVDEIDDNVTTTYQDYRAGDASLQPDAAGLFIRFDHIMPPRCRYIFGGDMRIAHSYGGTNPAAIIIAPVGRAADYDLNSDDETAALWNSQGSWMRVDAPGNQLTLIQGDGASATNTKNFSLATYTTLQLLVDAINATSFGVDGQQWRAQLCPGVNPEAPTSALLPHYRTATVTTATSTTVTIASGASNFAVGMRITKADIPANTYITAIVSDTQFTISAAATGSASGTATLWFDLGDTAITSDTTYQRVISNSLPGFLYFTKTYLDTQTFDKSSVWMTVATPGTFKSAANLWSGKTANRFKPPANAGISMGGAGVDQGFVTPFANGIYAIRNVRDAGSGIDEDYRMVAINESRGCIAWNTVVPGNRFVPYLTPEGLCAADLMDERLLSEALFLHNPPIGALDYEVPLSIAATAMDTDGAYASARIMKSAIWLSFRGSGSQPAEMRVYDFSSGSVSSGLAALFRPDGQAWGWSTPLVITGTAMVEARRDDGTHLYVWSDANAGSTGDGRIDEIETSGTDNGTAITGEVVCPWERFDRDMISGQDLTVDHRTPTSATTFLDFHRSFSDDESNLTLTGSSTPVVLSEFKFLPQTARAATQACYVSFRQTTGDASELRSIELRAKRVPRYVGGT